MRLKFQRLDNGEGLSLPRYASEGAAAMDVCVAEDLVCPGRVTTLARTGFAVEVPFGFELQVRPRSGLALKKGITISNAPGTVDSDYRGELCVLLHNLRDEATRFKRGDRIAQLVLAPVVQAEIEEASELSETARGSGGFGSTGRN